MVPIRISVELLSVPDLENMLRLSKSDYEKLSAEVAKTTDKLAAVARARITAARPNSTKLSDVEVKTVVQGDKVTTELHFLEADYTLAQLRLWPKQALKTVIHNAYVPLTPDAGTPAQFVSRGGGMRLRSTKGNDLLVSFKTRIKGSTSSGSRMRNTTFADDSRNSFVPVFAIKPKVEYTKVDLTDLPSLYEKRYAKELRQAVMKMFENKLRGATT